MSRTRSTPRPGHAPRYAGASTNPLSGPHIVNGRRHPGQKGIIVMLAKKAHAHRGESADVDAWRHEQVMLVTGVSSLTECTQADYLPLVAHFEGLAGEGGKQYKAAYRDLDEAKRQQRHLLKVALNERGLAVEYAEKICQTQYKRGLDDPKTTPEQLARVKFTVCNRRAASVPAPTDCPF